jgi:hypothetical protein
MTYFAFRTRSLGGYTPEHVKRLFAPLVFGLFIIVPPQIYYERIFNRIHFASYADLYRNVFEFVPYPKGSFRWYHLWFVAYLFLYSFGSYFPRLFYILCTAYDGLCIKWQR